MTDHVVVPFVGTWIEIFHFHNHIYINIVVPFVGTWIEISATAFLMLRLRSFPLWECGLKSRRLSITCLTIRSFLSWRM